MHLAFCIASGTQPVCTPSAGDTSFLSSAPFLESAASSWRYSFCENAAWVCCSFFSEPPFIIYFQSRAAVGQNKKSENEPPSHRSALVFTLKYVNRIHSRFVWAE